MAQRRMFSLKVVDTDTFLDMSASAQNLYFHLGMRADDDGFVSSPKKIMVMTNASEDDMKVLIAKGFVIKMATNGVSVITHWHTNNLIRPDRYQKTEYQEEKKRLQLRDGRYEQEFNHDLGMTFGIPNDTQMDTQVRLGKVRLGKDTNTRVATPSQTAKSFFEGGEEFKISIEVLASKMPRDFVEKEIKKFVAYWTEPNKSGTKMRWEQQPTFEVKRRLVTWFNNIKSRTGAQINRFQAETV